MTRDAFLARFGMVFENRPDLAAAVFDHGLPAPPQTLETLHAAFMAVLGGLSEPALAAFLGGHPDLAGAALGAGAVTADSAAEQGSAGLDALDPASHGKLVALNESYRRRFGFPFIMAVRGVPAADILAAFEARLGRDMPTERTEAVRQVGRILLLRLRDRMPATGP